MELNEISDCMEGEEMEKEYFNTSKKKTAERFQQLVNANYTEEELKLEIAYDICSSKTDKSLFMVKE